MRKQKHIGHRSESAGAVRKQEEREIAHGESFSSRKSVCYGTDQDGPPDDSCVQYTYSGPPIIMTRAIC